MSYNANTDYENEKEYLTDQIKQAEKTGNTGLLSWAKNQLGKLKEAAEKYVETSNNVTFANTASDYDANTNWDNESAYLDNLSKTGNAGEQAWANNQKNVLNEAKALYGTQTTKTYANMSAEEQRDVAIEAMRDVYNSTLANGDIGAAGLLARNAAVKYGVTFTPTSTGSSYSSPYNEKTDWENEEEYLTNLYQTAVQTGNTGLQTWVIEQMNALNDAMKLYDVSAFLNNGDKKTDTAQPSTTPTAQPSTTPTAGLGSSDIASWNDNYNNNNAQPTYTSKYDPQIDALLNEILTREDFSYNVEDDPLFSQYKQMYNREGERAMRNTLAEAAAGAGGMNTYAIAAAQQANNYYSSQLNDRIPELYQLAYEMYLQDKESKVQDLGILSDMDDKQYSRYRDTMSDWRADKDFAYGTFKDAVTQGNWETTFNYNQSVDNRNFAYQDYWAEKEWSASEQSKAQDEVWKLISLGVTPSSDLVAKAGMSQTDIDLAVAAVNAGGTSTGNNGYTGGGKGNTGNTGSTGGSTGDNPSDPVNPDTTQPSGITKEIREKCASFTNNEALYSYIATLVDGGLSVDDGDKLYAEYADVYEKYQPGTYTPSYSEMVKSTAGWKVDTNAVKGGTGGGNLVGIDRDAVVIAPNGESMRLDALREKLIAENMDRSEANKYIKNLQSVLGISSNWLFGL